MALLLSPARLAALGDAVNAIVPAAAFGFSRRVEQGRTSIFHKYLQGSGEWVLSDDAVPDVVLPTAGPARHSDLASLTVDPAGAFERFLSDNGVGRVLSIAMPQADGARLWVATAGPAAPTPEQLDRLSVVAASGHELLLTDEADRVAQWQRLELAANVLPTLLGVLDLRDVFDRLSIAAQPAVPHDSLVTSLFDETLTRFSVYARSKSGTTVGPMLPLLYAAAAVRAWTFSIVDDHLAHPFERQSPATKLGARSSLRVPICYGDRVIGALGFMSAATNSYSTVDVAVARRLADQVAVSLSHHQMAEEARRTAALREHAANLELLDELLESVDDAAGVKDVFDRVCVLAAKVLRHDAAALAVRPADGREGRAFATPGWPAPSPELIGGSDDRLQRDVAAAGFQSAVRVPIRREGQFQAALVFLSRTADAFGANETAVARRIADRLAMAIARDREQAATDRASELEARVRSLTDELNARSGYRRVIGQSKPWRLVLTQATQVASTTTTVLLLGESGTGKEVIARFLHRGSSRGGGPFVALNCAALPEQLLEAELFGYERGAFTGATQSKPGQLEQASGGTLFLDEVAEMSPSAQAKFLRVLQEREFQRLGGTRTLRTDTRIVAATNRNLPNDIANGKFREDLYYRLNVFAIHLPALRERPDDVLPLSEEFLIEIGQGLGRRPAGITSEARKQLTGYHWPGNVRELRNVLERAAILCDGGLITPDHLALRPMPAATAQAKQPRAVTETAQDSDAPADLHTVERTMIEQALESARFNKTRAAKALGLTRHQLYIRMRKHGFD